MQPLERRLPNQQRDPATEPWLRSAAADMEINMIVYMIWRSSQCFFCLQIMKIVKTIVWPDSGNYKESRLTILIKDAPSCSITTPTSIFQLQAVEIEKLEQKVDLHRNCSAGSAGSLKNGTLNKEAAYLYHAFNFWIKCRIMWGLGVTESVTPLFNLFWRRFSGSHVLQRLVRCLTSHNMTLQWQSCQTGSTSEVLRCILHSPKVQCCHQHRHHSCHHHWLTWPPPSSPQIQPYLTPTSP